MPDFSDSGGLEELREAVYDHLVGDFGLDMSEDFNESTLVDHINDWDRDVLDEMLDIDEDDYYALAEAYPEDFGYHPM
jgi:hypothetical protein